MTTITTYQYSPTESIDFVTYDAAREVTDLAIDNAPVINLIDLSWSHSTTPGTYVVWYYDGSIWINSGSSTTGTSITVDLAADATMIQLRNNNQPSNNVLIDYMEPAPDVTITAQNRYDGVKISWTPVVYDNILIKRGTTTIYDGAAPSLSYFVDTGATTSSANYTAQAYIGTSPDTVYSTVSNTVAGNKLTTTLPSEPSPVAADCFLGIKPGTGITDTGLDELGNPVGTIPAEGRFIIAQADGVEADLLGTKTDTDDTVYFHSDNDYIYVTDIIEITTYSTSNDENRFTLTAAAITALDNGNCYLVRFERDGGTVSFANPVYSRNIISTTSGINQYYNLDTWTFGGTAMNRGHYETGHTYIATETSVEAIKLYFLNVKVSGTDLQYISQVNTGLTPGGPGEVYIDSNYFRVNGIDFGTLKFLCNLGTSSDLAYVSGLRNLYDDVIPISGEVDPSLRHYGAGTCLQVLGSYPGTSGWYMDFENGRIWRQAGSTEVEWWNAAKTRSRMKYEGVSHLNSSSEKYITPATSIAIATPNNVGISDVITERIHYSTQAATSAGIADISLNVPNVYSSSIFGVVITPIDWDYFAEGGAGQVYVTDRQSVIFGDFNDYVPISKYYISVIGQKYIHSSGDPYYEEWFWIDGTVYMKRITDYNFRIYYSYSCRAKGGSVTLDGEPQEPGIYMRIPKLSYSFLQMR